MRPKPTKPTPAKAPPRFPRNEALTGAAGAAVAAAGPGVVAPCGVEPPTEGDPTEPVLKLGELELTPSDGAPPQPRQKLFWNASPDDA